jgi:hypothetical protein
MGTQSLGPVRSDGWGFPRAYWAARMRDSPEPFGWLLGWAVGWAGGLLEAETHSHRPNRWAWSGVLPGRCRRKNPGPLAPRSRGSLHSSGIRSPPRQSRCPSQSCNQEWLSRLIWRVTYRLFQYSDCIADTLAGMWTECHCEVNLWVLALDQPVWYEESYNLECSSVDSSRILPTFQ